MTEILKLHSVSKVYGADFRSVTALNRVSLSIKRGSFLAIVGQSGSGKSTLLNILGLLDSPTSGEVSVDGQVINKLSDQHMSYYRNRYIGFVFQTFNLFSQRTALENILIPCRIGGRSIRRARLRAFELLDRLGLRNRSRHFISDLSGGERQRVAIARALVMRPKIILADEPTGNLDEENANSIFQILAELSREGTSVVMVTHDKRLAYQAADCIRLNSGRVEP